MIITGGVFLLYVLLGTFATITGVWTPSYPFLSLLYLMRGVDTTRSQIATFAAFIAFGFGASVIRITLPTVVHLLIES